MAGGRDFASILEEHGEIRYPFLYYLRHYVLRYPGVFLVNRVAHVSHAALAVVPPYLLGVATDVLATDPSTFSLLLVPDAWLPATRTDQLLLTVGLLAAVTIVDTIANTVGLWTRGYLEEWPPHDFRTDAYDQAQRLGLEFFDRAQTGDVMSVLNHDVRTYHGSFRGLLNPVSWWVVTTGVSFLIMFALHWQFALVLTALLTPVAVISHVFDRRIAPQHAEVLSRTGRLNARIENSISGIETVKATTNEDFERDRVRAASREHRDASWAVAKTRGLFKPFTGMSTHLAAVIAFVVGAWWAVFGPPAAFLVPLTIGTFVTFFFYMRSFADNVRRVVDFVDTYRNFAAAAGRVHGLLATPATVPDAPDSVVVDDLDGAVEYENVTFRYEGEDQPALRDVSFAVEPGEYVGIVGPTGAGKTTLVKLLVRFYDPDEGTIRVDGQDIMRLRLESLRKRSGYVSQEPFLFDDTVRENVAYGDPDADDEAIVRAAKRANAHEFIVELEDGYDTRVGERGVKLSGGQRQRVAIARAILKDPDILILDEATSHVDNRTEVLIQEALDELIADRTTFAIAHSLATVRDADELLVLDAGEVVERGTHEALLDADGLYATLWNVHVGEVDDLPERLAQGGFDD